MRSYYAICILLLFVVSLACCLEEEHAERDKKLISTFQIVRFPNDVCVGTNSRNGTCYTSAECSDAGGTSSGSCADGFGVCCTFLIQLCDQTSAQNITYWTQPTAGATAGTCGLTVCPVTDDICQLRMDFTKFVITGPSTLSTTQVRRRFAQPVGSLLDDGSNAAKMVMGSSYSTSCLLDTFVVQGASPSSTPPLVCGTLATEHLYVEADMDRCNKMQFTFAEMATTAITATNGRGTITLATTREWDITVTQLECTNTNLPPIGCTQYFWGTSIKKIQSHNYFSTAGTSVHLGSQHQRFCIRREAGMCIGCFYGGTTDFNVSGNPNTASAIFSFPTGCCGYATVAGGAMADQNNQDDQGNAAAGTTQYGWDCVIIPGAFGAANLGSNVGVPQIAQTAAIIQQTLLGTPTADLYPTPWPPQICGHQAGLGIGTAALNTNAIFGDIDGDTNDATICTRHTPFTLEFMSDDIEGQGQLADNSEGLNANQEVSLGFSLFFAQMSC